VQARDFVFAIGVLIDISVLFIAGYCVFRGIFGWRARFLVLYTILGLNMDYAVTMIKLDRIFGWGGVWHHIALPVNANYGLDLCSRIALFIAIWLVILHLLKPRHENA
jgi:hypothetical protein